MNLAVGAAAKLGPLLLGTRNKQRLNILIFHRVLPGEDSMRPDEPTVEQFDWQMRLLREHFSPLPLLEAVQRLRAQELPERAVCVTFDDGYADNALCALPILQKYSIPASVFVSTAFLNGGRMWNDTVREAVRIAPQEQLDLRDLQLDTYALGTSAERLLSAETIIREIKHKDPELRATLVAAIENRVGALPDDLMLTTEQLQLLANSGVSIGAHTVNHPILSSVPFAQAETEIHSSKLEIEALIQREVELFAYPNGAPAVDYTMAHRDLVERLGFSVAVSTHWGVAVGESDSLQLPRFTPWDRQQEKFALRLLLNYRRVDPLLQASN